MNATVCCVCSKNLAHCNTIWAAMGTLYCSESCGIQDFKAVYNDNAKEAFGDISEEIKPDEIGII